MVYLRSSYRLHQAISTTVVVYVTIVAEKESRSEDGNARNGILLMADDYSDGVTVLGHCENVTGCGMVCTGYYGCQARWRKGKWSASVLIVITHPTATVVCRQCRRG